MDDTRPGQKHLSFQIQLFHRFLDRCSLRAVSEQVSYSVCLCDDVVHRTNMSQLATRPALENLSTSFGMLRCRARSIAREDPVARIVGRSLVSKMLFSLPTTPHMPRAKVR